MKTINSLSLNLYYRIIDYFTVIRLKKIIREREKSGCNIRVWWRDDDIVSASDKTKTLLQFVKETETPVFCSVIPKDLTSEAIIILKENILVTILQHGYSHINYASSGKPYNEYGDDRELKNQLAEIQLGEKKLQKEFQNQFLPVFVPPWGNVSNKILENISSLGFIGLSGIGSDSQNNSNLKTKNIHIDLHSWKSNTELDYSTELRSWDKIISDISKIIKGSYDEGTTYIGLLTHSQIMDIADWMYFLRIIRLFNSLDIDFLNRQEFKSILET